MPRVLQILLLSIICCWSVAAKGNMDVRVAKSLRNAFAQGIVDEVYFPDHASYQSASKAFNLRLQYKPAAIAYPRSTEEVTDVVKTCASLGIPGRLIVEAHSTAKTDRCRSSVATRSGGHSHASYCLGGADGYMVVDLSHINEIEVDEATHLARVGAGNRLGDVALGLFHQGGRAIPHGTCPLVGIGGHASYGG